MALDLRAIPLGDTLWNDKFLLRGKDARWR